MSSTEAIRQAHLIAGEWRPSEDAATFERANPFTGEVMTIASAASRADTRAAIDAAATPDCPQASSTSSCRNAAGSGRHDGTAPRVRRRWSMS